MRRSVSVWCVFGTYDFRPDLLVHIASTEEGAWLWADSERNPDSDCCGYEIHEWSIDD